MKKTVFSYTHIKKKIHKIETRIYKIQISNNYLKIINISYIFFIIIIKRIIFCHLDAIF